MQQGDYNSVSYYPHPYPHNPNPTPTTPSPNLLDLHQNSYASAPPYSTNHTPSDYHAYPPYHQNSDSLPHPTAPSFNPPPPVPLATSAALNTNSLQSSFNPPQQSLSPNFPSYDSHAPYQSAATPQSYYPPFDQNQTASSYAPPPPPPPSVAPNHNPGTNAPYASVYNAPPYNSLGSSVPAAYDSSYDNSAKFNYGSGYFDDNYGGYGRTGSDLGSNLYNTPSDSRYDMGRDDGYGDAVYAYEGSKMEPYGARGTAPKSSNSALFDDYGRAINIPSGKDSSAGSGSGKIVRAVPKAEAQQDVKSGVQKFRVKLLAESGGQSTMDVLCQIGLDGIHMLDPNTSRTLRIYPLENITRCDKTDSSTFVFWSKSSVDVEPRRIRLQSNSYTTSTLLDTVTAATVQIKEMGPRSRPTDFSKTTEQNTEKKKGLVDWMNIIKPGIEEKDHWVPDEAVSKCTACGVDFGAFVRRHHCRNCGDIFCDKCTNGRIALTAEENAQPVRVCDRCMAEVTQRLSNAKEAANKPAGLQSHEDLARKLQEEMEKNLKSSSGSKSDGGYGRPMKEVACPTCTVHLQVQVPSSGSETIECGVCQHPFLVSAN